MAHLFDLPWVKRITRLRPSPISKSTKNATFYSLFFLWNQTFFLLHQRKSASHILMLYFLFSQQHLLRNNHEGKQNIVTPPMEFFSRSFSLTLRIGNYVSKARKRVLGLGSFLAETVQSEREHYSSINQPIFAPVFLLFEFKTLDYVHDYENCYDYVPEIKSINVFSLSFPGTLD